MCPWLDPSSEPDPCTSPSPRWLWPGWFQTQGFLFFGWAGTHAWRRACVLRDSQQCSRAPPGLVHVGTMAVGCAHGREGRSPWEHFPATPAHGSLHSDRRSTHWNEAMGSMPHTTGLVGVGDTGIAHESGGSRFRNVSTGSPWRVCGSGTPRRRRRNLLRVRVLVSVASPRACLARTALALHALSVGRWEVGLPLHPLTPLGPAQGSAPGWGVESLSG